jgi:hypothetical protein
LTLRRQLLHRLLRLTVGSRKISEQHHGLAQVQQQRVVLQCFSGVVLDLF